MKKLLLFVIASTLSITGFAQSENSNAAEISFQSEFIDYGTIENGANGEREFAFTNTGKEPLIISKANGSCGCTVASFPRDPIAPGEEGVIKVKYDTKRNGAFQKTVTVSSNAKTATKVLNIKGVVKPTEAAKTAKDNIAKTSATDRT